MAVRLASQAEPIPGYKLMERLGRGGFGEVWKAEAPGGLFKAIKFVYGDMDDVKDKGSAGVQELRALNRVKTVRHPFILSLERIEIIDGQLMIVMELADKSLLDRFRECHSQGLPGIPREELLGYMEEAAEALDLMNGEYQLQHLDIKPQNLFLVRNHIKVADFGLVKDMEGMKATVTGGVTPVYAAPETFEGWVSRYCDQYSLAIVYQELLTGQRPFDGANPRILLKQHLEQEPDVSSLPPRDREFVRRALAKKPTDRYPSCGYLVQMLRGDVGEGGTEAPGGPAPSTAEGLIPLPREARPPASSPRPPAVAPVPEESTHSLGPAVKSVATDRPATPSITTSPTADDAPTTNRVAVQPASPVEFKGAGVLYPATVIGLGHMGVAVLQRLRAALHERFGDVEEVLPHIRLLGIDVDADVLSAVARMGKGSALTNQEMLLTRLNRPSHFLKPREGAVSFQTFLDPQLLYRIPRSQLTSGLRCLGRLALVDNYREIAERLQAELAACTEADAVAAADRQTKLGLRNNRPRVFVVASLAGGTGGGMFLDVAYLARHFLKQMGFAQPDVVGLFFVPGTQHQPTRPLAVGNTFAALAELNHFSSPGTTFTARYLAKAPPLTDADAPFGRCVFVPQDKDDKKNREFAALGAGLLYRDLVTPLGRAADERRGAVLQSAGRSAAAAPVVEVFGMHRLTWPRRTLIQQLGRRLCLKIVEHWVAKDPEPIRAEVEAWARDQWTKRQLEADKLILCLRAAAEGALNDRAPEDVFTEMAQRFAKEVPQGANPDPAKIRAALDELEKLVGRPEGDKPLPKTPALIDGLETAAKTLLTGCEQKLAEMAVHLIEQPRFRIVGAEEAIRQFTSFLQLSIQQQEPLLEDFQAKAVEAHTRIINAMEAIRLAAANRRKAPPVTSDVADLLRLYPVLRLRVLILHRVLTILRSLRGNCPEYLREFTYCRARLGDLVKTFETPPARSAALDLGPGHELFPAGCQTLDQTVNQFLEKVTTEELFDLDSKVQGILRKQFTALVHVCTTAANLLRDLEPAMQQEMENFVAARLGAANAVETFLSQYADAKASQNEILAAYKEAAPRVPVSSATEMALVVVPTESAAKEFRQRVQQALPGVEVIAGTKGDDIIFFREQPALNLADLPQTGPEAREAYKNMRAAEHFTPHSRTDITDWRLPQ